MSQMPENALSQALLIINYFCLQLSISANGVIPPTSPHLTHPFPCCSKPSKIFNPLYDVIRFFKFVPTPRSPIILDQSLQFSTHTRPATKRTRRSTSHSSKDWLSTRLKPGSWKWSRQQRGRILWWSFELERVQFSRLGSGWSSWVFWLWKSLQHIEQPGKTQTDSSVIIKFIFWSFWQAWSRSEQDDKILGLY